MNDHKYHPQTFKFPVARALRNLKTGKLGPAAKIYREDVPYWFPQGDPLFWRYMSIEHFRYLCEQGLYLARVDTFIDPMEGLPSNPSIHGASRSDREFQRLYPVKSNYIELLDSYEVNRRRAFCSCWHLNQRESRRMWSDRKTVESVAVATRLSELRSLVAGDVMVSMVKYLPSSKPRTELDLQSFLFFKDHRYAYERELRVVLPVWNGPVAETDVGRTLLLTVGKFIKRIVAHPFASPYGIQTLTEIAKRFVPETHIEQSQLRRNDQEWLSANMAAQKGLATLHDRSPKLIEE